MAYILTGSAPMEAGEIFDQETVDRVRSAIFPETTAANPQDLSLSLEARTKTEGDVTIQVDHSVKATWHDPNNNEQVGERFYLAYPFTYRGIRPGIATFALEVSEGRNSSLPPKVRIQMGAQIIRLLQEARAKKATSKF